MKIPKHLKYSLLTATSIMLLNCASPVEQTSDGQFLNIPKECKEIKSIVYNSGLWSLTCKCEDGTDKFYLHDADSHFWQKYEIVRKENEKIME